MTDNERRKLAEKIDKVATFGYDYHTSLVDKMDRISNDCLAPPLLIPAAQFCAELLDEHERQDYQSGKYHIIERCTTHPIRSIDQLYSVGDVNLDADTILSCYGDAISKTSIIDQYWSNVNLPTNVNIMKHFGSKKVDKDEIKLNDYKQILEKSDHRFLEEMRSDSYRKLCDLDVEDKVVGEARYRRNINEMVRWKRR